MPALDFRPLTPADKPTFDRHSFRRYCRQSSDLSFTELFVYNERFRSEWCLAAGFVALRYRDPATGLPMYSEPLGDGDVDALMEALAADARARGQRLRLGGMSRDFAERVLQSPAGGRLLCYENRAAADYIYLSADLAQLPGRRYQPKRNHVRQFERAYSHCAEPLTPAHAGEILRLFDRWSQAKGGDPAEAAAERRVIELGMDNFDALGMEGLALYADGQLAAFAYGSPLCDQTFCVHIEKADPGVTGASAAINQRFAAALAGRYTYLNREEDMGIPGLRRAKLSYHPCRLREKIEAAEPDARQEALLALWRDAFPDEDPAAVALHLLRHATPQATVAVARDGHGDEASRLVAVLYAHRFRGDRGPVGYLFALATLTAERGKGHGSRAVAEALRRLRGQGLDLASLIPASDDLERWYTTRFGFAPRRPDPTAIHAPDGLDFGTGTEVDNRLMYRVLDAPAYLRRYAGQNPAAALDIALRDPLFPQNDGRYTMAGGQVDFAPAAAGDVAGDDKTIGPAQLFELCPLVDTELDFEA